MRLKLLKPINYLSPGLILKKSVWRVHCIYVFCRALRRRVTLRALRRRVTLALYIINRLVFITEVEIVYCAVHTWSLYNRYVSNMTKTQKWYCLNVTPNN